MSTEVQVRMVEVVLRAEPGADRGNCPAIQAECLKCGRTHCQRIDLDAGGPVTRRKAAREAAIEALTEKCEHPLPWGLKPPHIERRVPKGVEIHVKHGPDGKLYPCTVEKGPVVMWVGGTVGDRAEIVVTPACQMDIGVATDFADALRQRGYLSVRVADPAKRSA